MGFENINNFDSGHRNLSNEELTSLTNMANNGNVIKKNVKFFIKENIIETRQTLYYENEQLQKLNLDFLPLKKIYELNNKKLDIYKKLKNLTLEQELEVLHIEGNMAEIESKYLALKDIIKTLEDTINERKEEIKNLEKLLN
jgi:hypothetical protein